MARKIRLILADSKSDTGFHPKGQGEKTRAFDAEDKRTAPAEADPLLETDLCFDKEDFLERFGGDEDIIKDILDSFFQEVPEFLEKIGKAVENQDLEDIRSNSHALKGAAANVNADLLKKAALELETQSKKGDPDF
nr:hypothetical protein [Desulfobacula sp.]